MYRILLLGSNPSRSSSSTSPFYGDSKSRFTLDRWLSMASSDNHYFHFENVSNNTTDNNRPLKMSEIRSNLDRISLLISQGDFHRIIAVGNTASRALTLLRTQHYCLPHPSGLNRKLNDKNFIEEKIKGLTEYIRPIY